MSTMTSNATLESQFSTSMMAEYESMRPEMLVDIFHTLYSARDKFYTKEAIRGLLMTIRLFKERTALKSVSGNATDHTATVSPNVWVKFLDQLYVDHASYSTVVSDAIVKLSDDNRKGNLPDVISFAVYDTLQKALGGMPKALTNEIKRVAEYRGITIELATAKFFELRDSFDGNGSHVGIVDAWIGEGSNRMKGYKFYYVPFDYSVLYALYRMRTDVSMFAVDTMNIVSVDIETAGPAGRDGFIPSNGRIIEVGMIEYTPEGVEVARYETLIRPEQSFLDEHKTGAVDIHQIEVSDLDDAPSWAEVAPKIFAFLKGKKLLAQNANFERSWFHEHLDGFTELNMLTVDTLEIAERFLPGMENNKLSTICDRVGVAYTNGHRAMHDALVTGDAYFKIANSIVRVW